MLGLESQQDTAESHEPTQSLTLYLVVLYDFWGGGRGVI